MFGATFCQKDGHADPFQCTQAYAQGAKRMGVEFLTYTEVTGLQTKAGRIHAVETTNGTFEARTVINCANVMRQSWLKWLVRTFLLPRNAIRRW